MIMLEKRRGGRSGIFPREVTGFTPKLWRCSAFHTATKWFSTEHRGFFFSVWILKTHIHNTFIPVILCNCSGRAEIKKKKAIKRVSYIFFNAFRWSSPICYTIISLLCPCNKILCILFLLLSCPRALMLLRMQASSSRAGKVKAGFFFSGDNTVRIKEEIWVPAASDVSSGWCRSWGWKHFQCSSSISRSCCTFFLSSAAHRAGCLAPLTVPACRGGGGIGGGRGGGRGGGGRARFVTFLRTNNDSSSQSDEATPAVAGWCTEKQFSAAAGRAATVWVHVRCKVCVRTRTRSGHSAGSTSAAAELYVFINGTKDERREEILQIFEGFFLLMNNEYFQIRFLNVSHIFALKDYFCWYLFF